MPTYSKKELSMWLLNDWLFDFLFTNWVNCGFIKSMKPSLDRLDDSSGYSFHNVQIMTWGENKAKGHRDMRSGKIIATFRPQKAVLQLNKGAKLIKDYVSANEASRLTGVNVNGISATCLGKRKTSGGYIWKFNDS